jgi:hypothetical protein
MKPAPPKDIPVATHSGMWKLGDLELRVHRLDDGRAVIDAEDFKKALEWLGLTEADIGQFGFGGPPDDQAP